MPTRRQFIQSAVLGTAATCTGLIGCKTSAYSPKSTKTIPAFLKGYEKLYAQDPRQATVAWFREAKFGLFMHYGLYSLVGRHEWVQLREKIYVDEYAKLKDRFTAEKFDADFITDLALSAQMKYINITSRHHDGFCLWDTKQSDFKSTNSPAKRDLLAELAEQCHKKGLGLFFYYSHGRDWKHPHAPGNDRWGGSARPKYNPPEKTYATGADHDLQKYLDFMSAQIKELLTGYGPIAGIWLDGIGVPARFKANTGAHFKEFHCDKLYDMIRSMQPQVLVSYKQGLLFTEDFYAPERKAKRTEKQGDKPLEICDTLQPHGWGYIKADEGKHKKPDQVMTMLAKAANVPANLLLNTGPLPNGAIHPADVKTLREVGRRIKRDGWPKASE